MTGNGGASAYMYTWRFTNVFVGCESSINDFFRQIFRLFKLAI